MHHSYLVETRDIYKIMSPRFCLSETKDSFQTSCPQLTLFSLYGYFTMNYIQYTETWPRKQNFAFQIVLRQYPEITKAMVMHKTCSTGQHYAPYYT